MSEARQTQIMENTLRDGRIKIIQRDNYLFFSKEYATNQTATSIIAAPGAGYRLVVKAIALATESAADEITLNGTYLTTATILGKLYVTKSNNLEQGSINIPLDENTAITLTTTTGTDKVLVKLNYVIEEV